MRTTRERAGGICTRAARRARVFIMLAEKREMRENEKCGKTRKTENESGEHAGNRLGECMGNRSGAYAVARESKRNVRTDKHMEGWLRNG